MGHGRPAERPRPALPQDQVGQLARRQAILNPKGTIYSAKRFIGRRYDEVQSELNAVSFDVVPGPDGAVRFKVRDKLYAPEEISALVLRKLAEDAGREGAIAVVWLIGIYAIVFGAGLLALAVELRRIHRTGTVRGAHRPAPA